LEWKSPSSLLEVQQFLGLANFYRLFIQDYSRVARPLTELTKGDGKDERWTNEAERAFSELKTRSTTAPILAYFEPERPVIVESDASDFALGAVLSQQVDEPAAAAELSGVGGINNGLLSRTNRQLTACTRPTGKSSNFPMLLKER